MARGGAAGARALRASFSGYGFVTFMPLDPRAKRLLDVLSAAGSPSALTRSVAERRVALADLMSIGGAVERVAASADMTLPMGTPVRVYTPADTVAASLPALLYFHGGGLVAGTLDTHDGISRALCNESGCRLISVAYRLAPEHRFPAALDDAYAASLYVSAHCVEFGADPARIGVVGDSAGATVAAALCQRLAIERLFQPSVQCLICPILEHAADTGSRRDLAEGFLLDRATLADDLRHYLGPEDDPADPRISPLRRENLAGQPPTLVHTAEFDPVRDEGQAYAERLSAAGVPVRYTCHPGMIHLFYGLAAAIPSARTALAQIGAELREWLG